MLFFRELFLYLMHMLLTLRMAFIMVVGFLISIILVLLMAIRIRMKISRSRAKKTAKERKLKVAFFHPYCNAGGGPEKVLWVAVQAMQEKYPQAEFYIFTGDVNATKEDILTKAAQHLNVQIDNENVHFIYLTRRERIEPSRFFTFLRQSIGSLYLGWEALWKLQPDIFIDTSGFTLTIPLFKYFAGCKTACYVHELTITTTMLKRVLARKLHNNSKINQFLTVGNLFYHELIAKFYALAGKCADEVMVNSSFIKLHLGLLWKREMSLVYPPCDVDRLIELPRKVRKSREIRILSLSPFRPEKDHTLQLQALYELRDIINDKFERITLVMVGSCRNEEDEQRVNDLENYAMQLNLEEHVETKVNLSYEELLLELQQADIGINTTFDESFGIGIVEMMAAGLITVAHCSGGPLLDIIDMAKRSRQGFLSATAGEYAHALKKIMELNRKELKNIRKRARVSVVRFSTQKFKRNFLRATRSLFSE